MLHLDGGRGLRLILEELSRLGYQWAYRIVDAMGFGVPQRRERVFIVASTALDPRRVLFADRFDAPPPIPRTAHPSFGFYWTEGIRGLGWAPVAVPTLKGGSTIGIPSPPAIWMTDRGVFTPDIRDAERMQGLDPDWTSPAMHVSKPGHRWKLVGNAVCSRAAEWIGKRLENPGDYSPSVDVPIMAGRTLPPAGWSDGARVMGALSMSKWASRTPRPALARWLVHEPRPLSVKATTGFLERCRRSSLHFADGFLEAIEDHGVRMNSLDRLAVGSAAA